MRPRVCRVSFAVWPLWPPPASHHAARVTRSSIIFRGAGVDRFSFFFAFYGLILGLAVTELLGGFAAMVRARALRRLEPETALLALLTFIAICATWIDAWDSLQAITLDFAGLWAPILLATLYYLAAAVIFPAIPPISPGSAPISPPASASS